LMETGAVSETAAEALELSADAIPEPMTGHKRRTRIQ